MKNVFNLDTDEILEFFIPAVIRGTGTMGETEIWNAISEIKTLLIGEYLIQQVYEGKLEISWDTKKGKLLFRHPKDGDTAWATVAEHLRNISSKELKE